MAGVDLRDHYDCCCSGPSYLVGLTQESGQQGRSIRGFAQIEALKTPASPREARVQPGDIPDHP